MKMIVAGVLICAFGQVLNAQQYDTVEVGMMTTVHLVFNSPVLEYDLGSGTRIELVDGQEQTVTDVLITKVGNRLKLAAAIEGFEMTNLFVETESAYFNFIIKYKDVPGKLSHYFNDQKAEEIKVARIAAEQASVQNERKAVDKGRDEKILELTLHDLAERVVKQPNGTMEIGQNTQRMKYFLNGIYVKGDYLFFRVNMVNEGNVKFDLGYEGFFIKDRPNRGLKKTTKQIPEPVPHVFIYNKEITVVEKREEIKKVYVFKKFTLAEKKIFTIEFWEEEGQRKVELNIPEHHILSAKTF
jgi:hypothetical protein